MATDLGTTKAADADYVIVTGRVDVTGRGRGNNMRPGSSICYVGDGNTGKVVAYGLQYDPQSLLRGDEVQNGQLQVVAAGGAVLLGGVLALLHFLGEDGENFVFGEVLALLDAAVLDRGDREAQRLALARALASEPEVLFLDEATASLDPASVKAIEDIILDASARGIRIILVTHDIGQAKRLADDVVFLQGGRVVEHSAARDFFPNPQSPAARDYLNGRLVF